MSTQKTEQYRTAEQFTWNSRVEGLRYQILPEHMDRVYPFLTSVEVVPGLELPCSVGYQAICISADPRTPNRFLTGHYYAPAVKINRIEEPADGGLELVEEGVIAWAKTLWGSDCRGGFPENAPGSDAKRMHIVLPHPDGTDLLVSRNGETEGFFRLSPYETDGQRKWRVVGYLLLQSNGLRKPIESAVFADDVLYVVRSKQDGTSSWLEAYNLDGTPRDSIPEELLPPETPFLYGIGYRNGKLFFITSVWKNVAVEPGIYCGRTLVVPGVCGNGIAFHNWGGKGDGDAYVTQYADGRGHQATPAFIIRVPARLFAK